MMTAVGRGRGNWGCKDLSAPLRRPGESSRSSGGEEDIIMREIASLNINDNGKFETIESQIKKYCVDRDHLWKMCQKMYESGAKDRSMVQKVVKFWKNLSGFEVNDVKWRSALLSTTQKYYEEREEMRSADPDKFLNSVALLGSIFHYLTLPSGDVYHVLVNPMIEYLELLVREGSEVKHQREAELEMLATQVNLNGKILKQLGEKGMEELTLLIRESLSLQLPSIKCSSWLLLVLDISAHGWSISGLPNFLKKFYSEKLGESFHQISADLSSLSITNERRNTGRSLSVEDAPVIERKPRGVFSSENNFQGRNFSHDKPSRKNWPDGSGDHKERRKPTYWGHDDRCDDVGDSGSGRDYGFSERGGKRGGGGGGWANWREKSDYRSQKSHDGGRRWNDESQSGYKPDVPPATTEESWD